MTQVQKEEQELKQRTKLRQWIAHVRRIQMSPIENVDLKSFVERKFAESNNYQLRLIIK